MTNANTATIARFPAPSRPAAGPEPGATAQECRDEIEACGLSLAQAAREMGAGVSAATLSKWLRGCYEGDAGAVAGRVASWLTARRDAAARDLTPAGLDRHVQLGVTEEIGAALAHARASGDIVLVHGRPGLGKSWAATDYCRRHGVAWRWQATRAVITLHGLLDRVATAVGAGSGHRSALTAETAIIGHLTKRRALLVVDEAHHLRPALLDELRCIRDAAGCGLALIGGDELWTGLARSPGCAQIVGRIGVRLGLGASAEADVADLAAGVLGRAPETAELACLMVAAHGPGGLHALRRLLARAWTIARADGRDAIAAGDLRDAGEGA